MDNQDNTVCLIEDDEFSATALSRFLEKNGYTVHVRNRGDGAVRWIIELEPDAVILDGNVPGQDGFQVCRELRPQFDGPIIMLTARDEDVDQILGFEFGADAYMTKPAEPRVVLAQLKACLRRGGDMTIPRNAPRLSFGRFTIDKTARTVELEGKPVEVTTAEFDLLWLLASRAGQIVSRDEIQKAMRGLEHDALDRSIDMRISRLRKRLQDDPEAPRRIKTVRAKGYLFSPTAWD